MNLTPGYSMNIKKEAASGKKASHKGEGDFSKL